MRKKGEEKVWKNLLNGLLRPYFLREKKKDEGYLRYFTEGRKGIPQRLGFDLWTKVSHKDVVMFWKARNKKVKILDCLDSKHSSNKEIMMLENNVAESLHIESRDLILCWVIDSL